jgi:hypothetical protein
MAFSVFIKFPNVKSLGMRTAHQRLVQHQPPKQNNAPAHNRDRLRREAWRCVDRLSRRGIKINVWIPHESRAAKYRFEVARACRKSNSETPNEKEKCFRVAHKLARSLAKRSARRNRASKLMRTMPGTYLNRGDRCRAPHATRKDIGNGQRAADRKRLDSGKERGA